MFLNHSKGITSCFVKHSILSCIFNVLSDHKPGLLWSPILDLSKYLMYDFHYNTWMKKFPNSTLLFTDTDSLAYEVVGHDLYTGMGEIKNEIDFSEYPKDNYLQSCDNMKVVGKG